MLQCAVHAGGRGGREAARPAFTGDGVARPRRPLAHGTQPPHGHFGRQLLFGPSSGLCRACPSLTPSTLHLPAPPGCALHVAWPARATGLLGAGRSTARPAAAAAQLLPPVDRSMQQYSNLGDRDRYCGRFSDLTLGQSSADRCGAFWAGVPSYCEGVVCEPERIALVHFGFQVSFIKFRRTALLPVYLEDSNFVPKYKVLKGYDKIE
jgi:hypothetical protein